MALGRALIYLSAAAIVASGANLHPYCKSTKASYKAAGCCPSSAGGSLTSHCPRFYVMNQVDGSNYVPSVWDQVGCPHMEISYRKVATTSVAGYNWWNAMSLAGDFVLIAARDSNTLYKIARKDGAVVDSLQVPDAPRYAPVVAGGHVFVTTQGVFNGQTNLVKASVDNLADHTIKDLKQLLSLVSRRGVTGPLASAKLDGDEQCGTRLFVGSVSYGYKQRLGGAPQTRPIGLPNAEHYRGGVACICSETMESCWKNADGSDKIYYNGYPYDYRSPITHVLPELANTNRSEYVGGIDLIRESTIIEQAERIIPRSFAVQLTGPVAVGDILKNEADKVQLHVLGVTDEAVHVEYYQAHWNTPSDTQVFDDGNSIASVHSMLIQSVHAIDAQKCTGWGCDANKITIYAGLIEFNYTMSSFSGEVDLSSYLGAQAVDQQFANVTFTAGVPGIDFSGATLKKKFAVGEAVSEAAGTTMRSYGGNPWTPGGFDGNVLALGFGNSDVSSVDRDSIFKPLIDKRHHLQELRQQALNDLDADEALAAIGEHDQIVEWTGNLWHLMSPADQAFADSALHAIDVHNGDPLWKVPLEGSDTWGPKLVHQLSQEDVATPQDLRYALGYTDWKDADANFAAVFDGAVYAGTKGGSLVRLNASTGEVMAIHRTAPGVNAYNDAPGNYGGTCVTPEGIMVQYGTTDVSDVVHAADYSWVSRVGSTIYEAGPQFAAEGMYYIQAWDSHRDQDLWYKTLFPKEGKTRGISCSMGVVFYQCKADGTTCTADIKTGVATEAALPAYEHYGQGSTGILAAPNQASLYRYAANEFEAFEISAQCVIDGAKLSADLSGLTC